MGGNGDVGGGGWGGGQGGRFATRSLLVFQCDNAKSQTVLRSDNRTPEAVGQSKNAKRRICSSA